MTGDSVWNAILIDNWYCTEKGLILRYSCVFEKYLKHKTLCVLLNNIFDFFIDFKDMFKHCIL